MALMAALVGFSIVQLLMAASTASAQDKITPFVLDTEVYIFELDPLGSLAIKNTCARRSDGATARVENLGPIKLGVTERLVKFMDGRSVTVVDAFKMKTTWSTLRPDQVAFLNAQRLRGDSNCLWMAGEAMVATDKVAGQDAVAVRKDLSEGGQLTRRMTDWRAPALGCQTITFKVEDQKPDGSWWLSTEGRLVSLKLEEPDPKLFDDGAGYTEATLSEIERKLLEVQGTAMQDASGSQKAEQVQYRITMVIVRGNRRVPTSTVRKSISIHPGDIYEPAKIEGDVAALKNTGYFDDVRAVTEDEAGTKDGKFVTFYVREKDELVRPEMPSSPPTPLPDEIGEQYKQASELLWAGELKSAQSAFEAVLQKKPDYLSAKTLLGLTLARLSAQSENLAETSLAVAQLREALAQDPDEAYWHKALAKLLHAQGKAEEAAKECARAAKLSPDDSDLMRGCGLGASLEMGNDDTIPNGKEIPAIPGATEPIPIHKPEPPYSEKARAARYQATSVLCAVIGVDGAVEEVVVEKPVGLGLDEAALRAVRAWTFKPATLKGTPIRVRIMAEVSFRLF
jgi:TonB family protein